MADLGVMDSFARAGEGRWSFEWDLSRHKDCLLPLFRVFVVVR